jgi:hypothetical protein
MVAYKILEQGEITVQIGLEAPLYVKPQVPIGPTE